jgi:hypothetical protein
MTVANGMVLSRGRDVMLRCDSSKVWVGEGAV